MLNEMSIITLKWTIIIKQLVLSKANDETQTKYSSVVYFLSMYCLQHKLRNI